MLLDVCLGTKTSWKILFVFAEAPGKAISRKEIQRLTRLGNKVLTKFLVVLEKFDVIIANKMGKTFYYKLNLSNPFAEQLLELIRTEKKELNNPDFVILNILREFVYELTNTCLENMMEVTLFGSYAKRTYAKDSDIDVAVIMKKKDGNDELLITEVIDRLNKKYKKIIQPHYFKSDEFKTLARKNRFIQEIKRDGIRLL